MIGSNHDSDDEKPVHQVTISRGFWMGQTEVTQRQWRQVMESNPSDFKSFFKSQSDNRPVERVSWRQAVEYANALSTRAGLAECYRVSGEGVSLVGLQCEGYRLPTEAEWEYAARAGSPSRYAGSDDVEAVAWYSDNADGKTHEVGTKAANAWGLHDMSGNVWEWCWDWHGDYRLGSVIDPEGPSDGSFKVFRGGGWYSLASYCSCSFRRWARPNHWYRILGLRLVRTLR